MTRYRFEGKLVNRIKRDAMRIQKRVPQLSHIKSSDFGVIISIEPAPRRHELTTLAEMSYLQHWLKDYVNFYRLKMGEKELPPYILTVYPVFTKLPERANPPKMSKTLVLLHELFHIPKNKRGCTPHTGFGDEVIYELYKKVRRK